MEEERSNVAMISNTQLAMTMDPNNSDCVLLQGQANRTYGEVSGNGEWNNVYFFSLVFDMPAISILV